MVGGPLFWGEGKHEQLFGIAPGTDGVKFWEQMGSNLCTCCLRGRKEGTHKQNSQEISGKCQDSPGAIPG